MSARDTTARPRCVFGASVGFPSWINRLDRIGRYLLALVKTKTVKRNTQNKIIARVWCSGATPLRHWGFGVGFRTFEPLCTPPHKTQKSAQSDHQTLGFQVLFGTLAGWSLKVPLSQPFRLCKAECVWSDISVHLNLCVPHPTKHKKVARATTDHPFLQWFGKASKP